MSKALTAQSLYDTFHEKLGLEWVAGQLGSSRIIETMQPEGLPASLIGHLNLIHPHRIQVLGGKELAYLEGLKKNSRKDVVKQLFSGQSDVIIVAGSDTIPDDIKQHAEATSTPLLRSALASEHLTNTLHFTLGSNHTETATLHGVFLEVMGIGVLITGDPSIGKSELALELISRGHRLIADDAPIFSPVAPDLISGSCPPVLQDFLEVRGLGVLNIRAMFGDSVIKPSKYLRLIIYLKPMEDTEIAQIDRLRGSQRKKELLGIDIPEVILPVGPGRNIAVMIEAAARNHILRLKGYDASEVFCERQHKHIQKEQP